MITISFHAVDGRGLSPEINLSKGDTITIAGTNYFVGESIRIPGDKYHHNTVGIYPIYLTTETPSSDPVIYTLPVV